MEPPEKDSSMDNALINNVHILNLCRENSLFTKWFATICPFLYCLMSRARGVIQCGQSVSFLFSPSSLIQGIEDINMDFYVQETPQGTLSFESVSYPGKYVYLKLGKRKNSAYVTEFSIFLVVSV